jgi:subtilisin family serine protease
VYSDVLSYNETMKTWMKSFLLTCVFLTLSVGRLVALAPSDFVVEFLNQPNPDLIILMRRPSNLQKENFLFNLTSHLKISGFNGMDVINSSFEDEPYVIHLKSESHTQTLNALSSLSQDARILTIEMDVLREPTIVYNDPGRINQWYLNNLSLSQAHDNMVSFGFPFGGSSDIVVAVIDTGLNQGHPEFTGRLWVNPLEIPNNGIDDDQNGIVDDVNGINSDTLTNNYNDSNGHGTHVSGVIAAATNNSQGMVSIAPNVRLMPIKASRFFPTENKELLPSSAIYNGLMYAYNQGAHIVNMSFGGTFYLESEEVMMRSLSEHMILVAAAGNEGKAISTEAFYPAAYDGVIGVMAYKQTANADGSILSSFSNYDNTFDPVRNYDIMAPGQNIYSTYPNQTYAYMNGTSMASPMVAGVAALLVSKLGGFNVYDAPTIAKMLIDANPKALGIKVNNVSYEYPKLNALSSLLVSPVITEVQVIDEGDTFRINVTGDFFLPNIQALVSQGSVVSITVESMKALSVVVNVPDQSDITLTLRHPDLTQASVQLFLEGDTLVEELIISPTSLTFTEATPQTIVVSVLPENASNKGVTFTSLDPNIVSVNSLGVVTPIRQGNTQIQVSSQDGAQTSFVDVSVVLSEVGLTYRVNDTRFPQKSSMSAIITGSTTSISSGSNVASSSSVTFNVTLPIGYVVIAWVVNGTRIETRSLTRDVTLNQVNNTVVVELIRRGDLNNDGNLTTTDLVQLQRLLAGILSSTLERQLAGDVNESNSLTTTDLVQLMRILAGIPLTKNEEDFLKE